MGARDKLVSAGIDLRVIYDSIIDMVTVQDTAFRILIFNKAVEKKFGAGLEGKLCYKVYHNRDDVCPDCAARKALASGSREASVQNIPGRPPQEITAYPLFNDKGEISAFIEQRRDIHAGTKRGSGIEALKKVESIKVLAGSMAHDFNNILTSIINNIFIAKAGISPDDNAFSRLESAEKAALKARELTRQFINFSRGSVSERKAVSLAILVEDAVNQSGARNSMRFEFDFPEGLWPVKVDEAQLRQVISNLITNADQAMPGGGLVRISSENVLLSREGFLPLKEGRYVKLTIRDFGTGILEKHLPRVFDPYFTTRKEGSGLGLASSFFIVKIHGGHITVESEYGMGSTFHIYLPASESRLNKRGKAAPKTPSKTGRVLLMEDNGEIRESVSEALKCLGYRVQTAVEGSEALELYMKGHKSDSPFDVVIMDMYVKYGLGARKTMIKLLEIDRHVKAVLTSGNSMDPVVKNFRNHGFRAVIAKPYRIEELDRILKDLME